jgi:GntR family transcriptional regulator, transcriptional repressor for pyruvate dehydrogenase complex
MAAADDGDRAASGHAAQIAADRLRDLIERGDLGPGDRLPVERVLAVQLGVSRSTLREGIRSLRSTGVLHARQGSGTYVTDLDPATLASPLVFALMRSGEVGGAELAAQHATKRDVEALRRLNDRIARTGGPAAMLAADWKFHHHIHVTSQNELLVLLLDSIAELGKGLRRQGIARDEIRSRSAEQHVAIIDAIGSRDVAAAGIAMRRHLDYVRQALQALEDEAADDA